MRVLISAVLAAGLWSTPGFSATILHCGRLVDVRAGQILMNVSVVVDGPTIRGIEPGLTAGSGEDTVIDLRNALVRLKPRSMLLIDECHCLGRAAAEELLLVLEEGVLNVTVNMCQAPVRIRVPPFTLIGEGNRLH